MYLKSRGSIRASSSYCTTAGLPRVSLLKSASAHAEAAAVLREVDLNAELEAAEECAFSELAGSKCCQFVARLQPHAGGDSSVRNFIHNVKAATALATELASRPSCLWSIRSNSLVA